MGKTDPLCIRLVAIGEAVQEVQNIIRSYLINFGVTEFLAKSIDDRPI